MKGFLAAILLCGCTVPAFGALPPAVSDGFEPGEVLRIKQQQAQAPLFQFGSGNPADAPLASRYYSYEVAVRVNCAIYTGRYDSAVHYLPAALRARNVISVQVTKHHMYFNLPGYQQWVMNIVHRKMDKQGCKSSVVGN